VLSLSGGCQLSATHLLISGLGDARDSLLGGGHEPRATRPISDGGGFGLLTVLDVVKGNDGDDDYSGILGSSDGGGCDSDAGEPSLDDRRQLGAVQPIIGHSYGLDGPIGRSCLCDEEVTPSAQETARIAKAYVDASVSRVEALAGVEDRSDDCSLDGRRQLIASPPIRSDDGGEGGGAFRVSGFIPTPAFPFTLAPGTTPGSSDPRYCTYDV